MLHFLLQKKLQIYLEWNQLCLASSKTDKCPGHVKKKKLNKQTTIITFSVNNKEHNSVIILKGKEWGTEDSMIGTSRIIGTKQETG